MSAIDCNDPKRISALRRLGDAIAMLQRGDEQQYAEVMQQLSAIAAPGEPVVWSIERESAELSLIGWHDMRNFKTATQMLALEAGAKFVFAYRVPGRIEEITSHTYKLLDEATPCEHNCDCVGYCKAGLER